MTTKITITDIATKLDEVGLQYLATVGLDGKPKVRPVQYMVVRDEKLWFCTNREKAMYAEMQKLPFVDLCGSRLQDNEITTTWIRLSAEVVFPQENTDEEKASVREVKKAIMQKSSIVHELYQNNPDHPLLAVFYLKDIRGSMNNLGHVKGLEERADFAKPIDFEL